MLVLPLSPFLCGVRVFGFEGLGEVDSGVGALGASLRLMELCHDSGPSELGGSGTRFGHHGDQGTGGCSESEVLGFWDSKSLVRPGSGT